VLKEISAEASEMRKSKTAMRAKAGLLASQPHAIHVLAIETRRRRTMPASHQCPRPRPACCCCLLTLLLK